MLDIIKKNFTDIRTKRLVNKLYKKYNEGLYIGRYLARPAIVEYRVSRYNDKSVTFWYENKKTRKKITVIIDVLEFIGKLTQHIHQKGFRVIRRYGFFTCISVSPFCSICNLVYNNIQITLFNNKFTHRYIFFEDFMIR